MEDVTLYVEVLDRRGAVSERVPLTELPATLGRAYRNVVIIDDPYVCPVHARITRDADSQLVVEDLGSVNGLYLEGARKRVARLPIRSGMEIQLGRTRLRLVSPGAPVPPAIAEGAGESRLLSAARSPLVAGIALIVAAGSFVLSQYLGSYEDVHAAELAGGAVTLILLLALWAGIWALVSRVVVHRFNFVAHYAVALSFLVLALLYGTLSEYVRFLFASLAPLVLIAVAGVALLAALLFAHLTFVSTLSKRQRWAWSTGIALLILCIGALVRLSDQRELTAYTEDPGSLKPVAASLIPAEAADEYIAGVAKLKAEIDELAVKE